MKKNIFLAVMLCFIFDSHAAEKKISLSDFINEATQKDSEFESILIDQLPLKYQRELKLPAGDFVLSLKQQHNFYMQRGREEPETTLSLSKLFPLTGTDINVSYSVTPSRTSVDSSSKAGVSIAQPIARNAFGRDTRLLDKITGLEVNIAQYQIVEAYEDYLASLIQAYYRWYETHQNLTVGRDSYRENMKLLDNIKERQQNQIALPIDVNKVTLQVKAKQETLIELEQEYAAALNIIETALRYEDDQMLVPVKPELYADILGDFDELYAAFLKKSRTHEVLTLLEKKSSLEVSREADALLPSIDMLLGYEVNGENYKIDEDDNELYVGFDMEWPFWNQVQRAEKRIAVIEQQKTKLRTLNTHYRLFTNLENLFLDVEREQKLGLIADEKISLAQSILDDESENYSFGKVTLNDYIQAVNAFDSQRFNKIQRDVRLRELIVEWLRLTDQLVQSSSILEQ